MKHLNTKPYPPATDPENKHLEKKRSKDGRTKLPESEQKQGCGDLPVYENCQKSF